MKKVIYDRYGSAAVLEMIDVPMPAPAGTQLLIQVKAVSLNPLDWKIMEGKMKLMSGSTFPKGIGIDFSGVVEQVGEGVTNYRPGDAVFGAVAPFKGGALAEYLLIREKDIALKPATISFEQAAAMPTVGTAALQILEGLVRVGKGTQVLINGASGGIGMFAIQIAKMKGAHVTSVASTTGLSWVKRWGSDAVLDYRKEDVLSSGKRYDVVLDLSGKMPYQAAKRIMKPESVYVNSIPGPREIVEAFLHSLFSKQKYKVLLLKQTQTHLESLSAYAAAGVEILVGASFPMASFRQAYAEASAGGIVGKAVVTVGITEPARTGDAVVPNRVTRQ
ncbi:MAG: NAD(P)-dependent alcohol dehydrogenase [Cytophagales bacterium]|nr:NAD(P)-dependent alcohol dehydrogenase [Cytophagales bacterium]